MNNVQTADIVLSSLLTANEYKNISLDVLMAGGITKQWFITPVQKDIFEVISVCYKANRPFNENLVIEYLNKTDFENPENIILHLLSIKQVSQEIILEYIKNLREDFRKRLLLQLNEETAKMLNDPACDTDAITILMQNTLNDYEFLNNKGHTRRLDEVRKERKVKPPRKRIKTHIPFIDSVFTDKKKNVGIKSGLGFISGLKESGKTFTLTRIIENVSKDHSVLFGSMEFGDEDYDENIEEQQEENFFNGNTKNIYIFDDVYDINKIVAEIRFQYKIHGIKLVCLDSMLRITNNDASLVTNEKRLSDMFSKLGKLAKELDLPIIIIVQSSKEDLKSSIVSVKGCMDADHESYWWYHLYKTHKNKDDDEQRTVVWVKNKDTKKHPKQHLMFVPQTCDFYRITVDKSGNPTGPIDNYRKPVYKPAEANYDPPVLTVWDAAGVTNPKTTKESDNIDVPDIFDQF
jgi:replicative DNA helicase